MPTMVNLCCEESTIIAVVLGGGAGGCLSGRLGKFVFYRFFGLFCCNSYVDRSIKLCMYVDNTKFDLTP
jgi:hypothetical protein